MDPALGDVDRADRDPDGPRRGPWLPPLHRGQPEGVPGGVAELAADLLGCPVEEHAAVLGVEQGRFGRVGRGNALEQLADIRVARGRGPNPPV